MRFVRTMRVALCCRRLVCCLLASSGFSFVMSLGHFHSSSCIFVNQHIASSALKEGLFCSISSFPCSVNTPIAWPHILISQSSDDELS